MAAVLMPQPRFRAFDSDGAPLAGGRLFSFAAGTTTPLATYIDSTQTTQNTNPVVLDANGEADVWLAEATLYKVVLEDVNSVVQYTVDNMGG